MNVIILAAGRNKRAGGRIKALMPGLDGTPLLLNTVTKLRTAGFSADQIFCTVNRLDTQMDGSGVFHSICQYFNRSLYAPRFRFQPNNVYGTAAALLAWQEEMEAEDTMIVFGDNWYESFDHAKPFAFGGKLETTAIVSVKNLPSSPDNLRLAALRPTWVVPRLVEKPHLHDSGQFFCGWCMVPKLQPDVLNQLSVSPRGEVELIELLNSFPILAVPVEDRWADVTTGDEVLA